MPKKKETIMAICAHNDDQIIGAGGTLAKYARQGKRIRTIVLSFGESSHPHFKRKVIVVQRVKESLRSDKILGGSGIAYFGLKEGHFEEQFKKKKIGEKLAWIINNEKPAKIFTHSADDIHPDHKATNALVLALAKKHNFDCEIYSFDVWNLVKLFTQNLPKLVVDITDTFQTKIKALKAHESQKLAITTLLWNIYLKARINGIYAGTKFAEVFYRLK